MPIQRELDKVERLLRTTVTGPFSLHDVRDHIGLLRRTGASQMPELIDARGAEHSGFSRHDLLGIAHHAREALSHMTPARRALVVGPEAGWSVGRTFASFVAGWLRFGVFEEIEAAEQWLRGAAAPPRTAEASSDSGLDAHVPAS
jgi:hypothetical protein